MDKRQNETRRKSEKMESLKASFWLKIIAILLTLMATVSSLAVTVLFSIYGMTAKINERGFQLMNVVSMNTKDIKSNSNMLNNHGDKIKLYDQNFIESDKMFTSIDVRLAAQEKKNLTASSK